MYLVSEVCRRIVDEKINVVIERKGSWCVRVLTLLCVGSMSW